MVVEVRRGGRVESRHAVHAAVVAGDGAVRLAAGDVEGAIFPRSALKPFQALPLVETGAADALKVGEDEIALACASHSGEAIHLDLVGRRLERLGLDDAALACGPHWPRDPGTTHALIRAGAEPRRVHSNCSGKHVAMLAVCRHMGWPEAGYERPDHPLQRRIAATIAQLAGLDALDPPGVDGCSLPAFVLPLVALARASARLADPAGVETFRGEALRRVAAAMRAHPRLVAGTGRICTALMATLPDLVVKTGAEGVFMAALPREGLGVALKAADGATRAAEAALMALLEHLGVADPAHPDLAAFARPVVRDFNGRAVGAVAVVEGWGRP